MIVTNWLNTLLTKSKVVISFVQTVDYSTKSFVKTIEVKTCGQLYTELRQTNPKLYRNSPTNGLDLNIEYVDTFADNESKLKADHKTVVAIHGIPGYHYHFKDMIRYFSGKDSRVRFIAPNMPDFGHTRKTMSFWHSNRERSQFIRDFLKALDISQIDCLVSHSAGIHPISLIWSNPQDLTIKSIGLMCPQPLWFPSYFFNLSKFMSTFATNRLGIKLMDALKPHMIAHRMGYPMSYANVDEVLLTVMLSSNGLDQNLLHDRLKYIRDNKLKTLIVYGERDKLIKRSNFDYLIHDLAADQKDIEVYDNDGQAVQHFERQYHVRVLWFRTGGHFAYARYNDIVNKYLTDFCLQP